MKAFGILGLALVLFAILILAPFAKRFTEGFADSTPTVTLKPSTEAKEQIQETADIKEKVMALNEELETFKKMLGDPSLSQSTKDKITKEITDRQTQIATLTNQPTPSEEKQGFEDYEEEFEGVISADLEKNTKAADLLQKATQSPL
jgi:predicted RNase H-like nuclease (RuvC/YqgF family)